MCKRGTWAKQYVMGHLSKYVKGLRSDQISSHLLQGELELKAIDLVQRKKICRVVARDSGRECFQNCPNCLWAVNTIHLGA